MRWRPNRILPTFGQAANIVTPNKARGQAAEAQRRLEEQRAAEAAEAKRRAEEYQRQLEEYQKKLREQQESAARTQAMTPPEAQQIGPAQQPQDNRLRRNTNRGSLLAGNTGGYNPATGGGRLGGRSLLG
jgi:hypothetical protein